MSRFTSIPVKAGDSFLLEMEEADQSCIVLVDGGFGRINKDFITPPLSIDRYLLKKNISKINVMIATHNDADHTNGLIKILQNPKISVDEIWLPAIWLDRLKDLNDNPEDFFDELIHELLTDEDFDHKELNYWMKDDEEDDEDDEDEDQKEKSIEGKDSDIYYASDLVNECDFNNISSTKEDFERSWKKHFPYSLRFIGIKKDPFLMITLADYFEKAEKILKIVKLAKKRSKIRWFKFSTKSLDLNLASVNFSSVKPVNSKYVTKIRINKKTALEYLYLSEVNRRSLVFHFKDGNNQNPILFCADSDLDFDIPKFDEMIVTAPHHGVESASKAYLRINQLNKPTLVRNSGYQSAANSGDTFIQSQHIKYCDVCNTSKAVQEVSFRSAACWAVDCAVIGCSCS